MYEKKDMYEKSKVKEYWIVNPYMKSLEVLTLNAQGVYRLFSEGYMEGENKTVRSEVLKGLEVNLEEVFIEVV